MKSYLRFVSLTLFLIVMLSVVCSAADCLHTWMTPVFFWSADRGTAEAVRTCSVCGETETAAATVLSSLHRATCTEEGYTCYTAYAAFDGKSVKDTQTDVIPKTDHLGLPEFIWSESGKTCDAFLICTECDETVYTDCTVTASAGSASGDIVYTASVTVGGTEYTDTLYVSAPKTETHSYSTPKIVWNADHTATAVTICAHCEADAPEKVISVPCDVIEETVPATCTAEGKTVYTAQAVVNGIACADSKTVIHEKLEHTSALPLFLWNDTACTYVYSCPDCDIKLSSSCRITEETTPATCTAYGVSLYTASASVNGREYTDTKTVTIPVLAHSYTEPVFVWGTSGDTCTASFICTACDQSEYIDCTVTESEGSVPGDILYTASVTVGGTAYTDTLYVSAPKTETHSYSTPKIVWNDDHTATAVTICAHCEADAPEKVISVPCDVIEETVPATCTAEGKTVYTAQAVINGIACADSMTVTIPMLAHNVAVPVFTWDGDRCTFAYSCTVCAETYTGECAVTEQVISPGCTEPGTTIYTASVDTGNRIYTDTQYAAIPPKGHTDSRLPGTAATCTEAGVTDGIVCAECGEILLEGFPIEPLGHAFGTAEFSVNDDGSIIAVKHCANNCGEMLIGTVTVTVQDADHPENVIAAAVFPDGTTVQIPMTLELPEEDPSVTPSEPALPDTPPVPVFPDPSDTQPVPADPNTSVLPEIPAFDDVPANSYYFDAVLWAAQTGISRGTGDGSFSPDMICTRAQAVTMLWRAAGAPAPDSDVHFSDVEADAYYAAAVAWAAERGITVGTSEDTFSPDLLCTRAQILTMLWRAAGSLVPTTDKTFSDVPADAYYANAVAWAVYTAVTQGTGDDTFSPDAPCTRAQIVTFLWRVGQTH